MASAAQLVTIIPCRFMGSSGQGDLSNALRCWDYCIQLGSSIINNSWGSTKVPTAMQTAANAVTAAGITMICSAGNEGVNVDTIKHYPSGYSTNNQGIISVGAFDSNGEVWQRSNFGSSGVTIAAPGTALLGLGLAGLYIKQSGTSMAGDHMCLYHRLSLKLY